MADTGRLEIKNIPQNLKDDLKEVARKNGITMSSFIKPVLRKAVQEEKELLKKKGINC